MEPKPIRFISEPIQPLFDKPPMLEKTPGAPDGFIWRERHYRVIEVLQEWRDYRRKGRMARNMQPQHAEVSSHRGSWGVGIFYFRVRTDSGQLFDLYYDRSPKDASHRKGDWFIFQELTQGG